MTAQWRAVEAGLEAATVVCAALNLAFFWHKAFSATVETRSRRAAAFVLALVSLGAMAEGVFVLALVAAPDPAAFASLPWVAVRALTLAGTAGISVLVLRRIADE